MPSFTASRSSFTTNLYALFSLLGCLSAIAWHYVGKGRRFLDEDRAFLIVDAIGLAVFAVIGASAAASAGLKPWSVVVLAALTGAGGGRSGTSSCWRSR